MSFFGAAGNSTSNAGASPGLFGQPQNQQKPSGSLFGSTAPSSGTGASTPGSSAPAPLAASGNSLFGGGTAQSSQGTALSAASSQAPSAPASGTGSSLFPASAATPTSAPNTTGATAGSGAGSSSIFGAPKTTGTSSLFGQLPAGNSTIGQAPTPTSTTSQPAASGLFSSFGAKPSGNSATQSTSSAAPLSGGLFGATKPVASSTPTPANGSSTSATTTAQNPAPTPASSGGLLGGSLFGTKPAEKKDGPATSSTTSGLFGSISKPEAQKDGASAAMVAPASVFGSTLSKGNEPEKSASSTGAPTLAITGAAPQTALAASSAVSAPQVAVPPPSMLRGKTIEEIVNRWTTELETHVKEFNRFANEVSVWDRALAENGNNLAALLSFVLAAEREQSDIERSLDHIEDQQKSLSATLDAYEKSTQEIMSQSGLRALDTGPADTERDKNYTLATELHTQLDDLAGSLSQMIDSVNTLSSPSGSEGREDDPMVQIAQILNSHLESLQWIDSTAGEVESKVVDIERRVRESGLTSGSMGRSKGYGLKR